MPIPGRKSVEREFTYRGRTATLILGRNEDYDVEADGVVSDPPYGIGWKGGRSSTETCNLTDNANSISTVGKKFQRSVVGDEVPFDPSRWLNYGCVAFTGAQHFYSSLPPGGMLHCWDKRGEYKPLDQADADLVWVSNPHMEARQARVFHLVWRGLCRHSENKDRIVHPTQKPIALMKWIIDLCDIPLGGRVYDPYMGSGTTGLAALQCGYDFIGVETVEEYYLAACKRYEDLVRG